MGRKKRLGPRKEPAQNRSRETVEAILEAAAHVFSQRGYASGTTNHIASRAGVSIGSLYQYFPNKDSILIKLLERHIREGQALMEKTLTAAREGTHEVDPMLRALVDGMVLLHKQNPRLHRVLFEEAPRPQALVRLLREVEESTAQQVEALLETIPGIKVKDTFLAARLAVQMVESLTHWFVLSGPQGIENEQFTTELVRMLRGYLFS
jgi:AcrR family transcriptional regulator